MRRVRYAIMIISLSGIMSYAVVNAATGPENANGHSVYMYTGALTTSKAGVTAVPARFKWSVETSWRGIDAQGSELPDTRILLRLYDPSQNFTAMTAQLNLETAEKLQRELAQIIAAKRKDPHFQHRPQLYDSRLIPTGELKGVDSSGQAIIELQYKSAKDESH